MGAQFRGSSVLVKFLCLKCDVWCMWLASRAHEAKESMDPFRELHLVVDSLASWVLANKG